MSLSSLAVYALAVGEERTRAVLLELEAAQRSDVATAMTTVGSPGPDVRRGTPHRAQGSPTPSLNTSVSARRPAWRDVADSVLSLANAVLGIGPPDEPVATTEPPVVALQERLEPAPSRPTPVPPGPAVVSAGGLVFVDSAQSSRAASPRGDAGAQAQECAAPVEPSSPLVPVRVGRSEEPAATASAPPQPAASNDPDDAPVVAAPAATEAEAIQPTVQKERQAAETESFASSPLPEKPVLADAAPSPTVLAASPPRDSRLSAALAATPARGSATGASPTPPRSATRSPSPGRAVLLREIRRLVIEEAAARAAVKTKQHVAFASIAFPSVS